MQPVPVTPVRHFQMDSVPAQTQTMDDGCCLSALVFLQVPLLHLLASFSVWLHPTDKPTPPEPNRLKMNLSGNEAHLKIGWVFFQPREPQSPKEASCVCLWSSSLLPQAL